MAKENWIVTQLKNSTVYFLVLIIAVVIFGIRLQERVFAIEKRNVNVDPLVERFIKLEEQVKNIDEKTTRIEEKIDTIINQYIQLGERLEN